MTLLTWPKQACAARERTRQERDRDIEGRSMRLAAPPLTVLFFALGLHGCAATRTTGLFLMGAGSVVAFAGVYGLAGCTGDPPSA